MHCRAPKKVFGTLIFKSFMNFNTAIFQLYYASELVKVERPGPMIPSLRFSGTGLGTGVYALHSPPGNSDAGALGPH